MGADSVDPYVATGNGDIEGTRGGPSKTLQRRGGIVCEKRIVAAREHGGLRPRKKAGAWRSPEVDAAVHRVQQPALDPVRLRAASEAERGELS